MAKKPKTKKKVKRSLFPKKILVTWDREEPSAPCLVAHKNAQMAVDAYGSPVDIGVYALQEIQTAKQVVVLTDKK